MRAYYQNEKSIGDLQGLCDVHGIDWTDFQDKEEYIEAEARVLVLGLDSAGKTTVIYKLIGAEVHTIPTIGVYYFNAN